ncbi:amino acid synthesis family protein [Streptomyces shenzhenensis]
MTVPFSVRKVVMLDNVARYEAGRPITGDPWRTVVVAAVVKNPWYGCGYVADLDPEVRVWAPAVGELIVPRLIDAFGGPDNIESYGKAALGGDGASIEQSAALIQTLRFGNVLRNLAGGETYMTSTCKRGSCGAAVTVPLGHKNQPRWRSFNATTVVTIPDAPRSDEIVVAVAGSNAGRPFARPPGMDADEGSRVTAPVPA